MRMERVTCLVIVCAFSVLAPACLAAEGPARSDDLAEWVNEGKWPRGPLSVEVTPDKQAAKAAHLQDIGDSRQAAEQYRRLADVYTEADQAAEGLILSAKNYLAAGDYTKCREQLTELRRRYANPPFLDAIGEVEITLGRGFLEGKGEGGTYRFASRIRKATAIFQKQFELDPQGRWADAALLGLGQCAEALFDYDLAIKKYKELLSKYPRSELRAEAESHIAACINRREPKPNKTETDSEEARARLEAAREDEKLGDLDLDMVALEENEKLLTNRLAEKRYDQAIFYQKNGHYRAAEVYFELIKQRYPKSPWAEKSIKALEQMKKR